MSKSKNSGNNSHLHLLLFPFPAQGHLLSFLDFSHHLSLLLPQPHALTIVTTPSNLSLLSNFLSSTPSASPLVLDPIEGAIEHVRHQTTCPSTTSAALTHSLSLLKPSILNWARSHSIPISAVVSDDFLGWTLGLADELKVPRIVFHSLSAFTVSVFDFIWSHMVPVPAEGVAASVTLSTIPGSPSLPYFHLPTIYQRYKAGEEFWECAKDSFLGNANSWGIVINTFDALEAEILTHLRRSYGHGRVWAVGPISPAGPTGSRGGTSSVAVEKLTSWLDECAQNSVVYICFGSQFAMKDNQARTITAALELSVVPFVWVVGTGTALPEGFEERTTKQGMVIKGWAPQVAILQHRAVGSFVTHCGWNSVLEGVAAGVTLLAWPMQADQFLNSKLVVDVVEVAVKVGEGWEQGMPTVEELAENFTKSVTGGWPDIRERVEEIERKAAEAVADVGSSSRETEELVKELTALVLHN